MLENAFKFRLTVTALGGEKSYHAFCTHN